MLKSIRRLIAAAIVLAGFTAHAAEPEDIIKYRQAFMKSVGGHMGSIAQIVRGKVDYKEDLVFHAQSIATAMRDVPKLFPDGSDFGETRALESIWDKPDDFNKAADAAKVAAEEFAIAVGGSEGAELMGKFKNLVDGCKGCHKDFREEDK